MIRRLAATALCAAAGVAHGAPGTVAVATPANAPDDPAVEEARDANLESIDQRRGMTFAFASGGGFIVGFGIDDSVGRGSISSFRVGHVATRRTIVNFELQGGFVLHKPTTESATEVNISANFLVGPQYYVNPSLWIRGGGGVGVYLGRQIVVDEGLRGDVTLVGPAALFGFGVEILRFRWVALEIEASTCLMANSDGVLMTANLGFGFSFD